MLLLDYGQLLHTVTKVSVAEYLSYGHIFMMIL